MWTDLIIRLNEHEIRIHLSGDRRIANVSKLLVLENLIRIKLIMINVITSGVIYENSTIRLIRVNGAPKNVDSMLMILVTGIMIIPILVQLIRRRAQAFSLP